MNLGAPDILLCETRLSDCSGSSDAPERQVKVSASFRTIEVRLLRTAAGAGLKIGLFVECAGDAIHSRGDGIVSTIFMLSTQSRSPFHRAA